MRALKTTFWFALLQALALFVCSTALAQGAGSRSGFVQRSNFLKPFQYATQQALPLFVDGTLGSDLNDCSGTGTSACATLQAAMNLIPFLVNHPVTVDVAAGSYAGFRLYNHSFAPTDVTTGAYIAVRGAAQTNFAVATGTATGTLTGVTTDSVGFHVLTDATQTWTASDLSTRFFSLVTGTGAGQTCPIISNTATTVTVSCTFAPAPIAGTTYAVVTPSVLITSAASSPASLTSAAGGTAGIIINNTTTPRQVDGFVVVQDIQISGALTGFRIFDASNVTLTRMRLATTTGIGLQLTGRSYTSFNFSTGITTGAAVATLANATVGAENTYLFATSSFLTGSNTTGTVSMLGNHGNFRLFATEVSTTNASGLAISILGGGNIFNHASGRLRCASASSNFGVNAFFNQTFSTAPLESAIRLGTVEVTACGTGLRVHDAYLANVQSDAIFLSNTLAISAVGGGRVMFNAGVPTFTTNTTDLSVDGSTSTRAAFVALVPNSIVNLNFLSAVFLLP